jgi:D-3-phosphoglycerate dehydrogenase
MEAPVTSRRIVVTCNAAAYESSRFEPLIAAGFELVERLDLEQAVDVATLLEGVDGAWATIAGSEPYSRELLAAAGSLRVIARWGAGYDAIDLAAATEHGAAVLLAPGANADAVADCALLLMLAAARQLLPADHSVRSGRWRLPGLTGDLTGATVGVVGLGAIGRAVVRRLAGFDCQVIAAEPSPDAAFCAEYQVEVASLQSLLSRADIVTVHVPLTGATTHLIGQPELELMRPGSILVNTSRGPAVDEAALIDALRRGHLGAAGLDVFEHEPLAAGHPLTELENVVLSGHAASFTRLAAARTADVVVANLLYAASGELPANALNPEAWS